MGKFDENSAGDLPDLPAEWGVIVIPDDLSELSDEVHAIQAELRLTRPRTGWQRLLARPAARRLRRIGRGALRAPFLIISMAVLVTVASLFASAWSGPARSPATPRGTQAPAGTQLGTLPALELYGPDGGTVPLRGHLPAVVLLVDGCDCERLIADTVAAVRPEVAVVTVTTANTSTGSTPPAGATPQAQGKVVRELRDPTGELRGALRLGPGDGVATALLVGRDGAIKQTVPRADAIERFKTGLATL